MPDALLCLCCGGYRSSNLKYDPTLASHPDEYIFVTSKHEREEEEEEEEEEEKDGVREEDANGGEVGCVWMHAK